LLRRCNDVLVLVDVLHLLLLIRHSHYILVYHILIYVQGVCVFVLRRLHGGEVGVFSFLRVTVRSTCHQVEAADHWGLVHLLLVTCTRVSSCVCVLLMYLVVFEVVILLGAAPLLIAGAPSGMRCLNK
jgi:hypothetical protein